jgi:hypothetical protein
VFYSCGPATEIMVCLLAGAGVMLVIRRDSFANHDNILAQLRTYSASFENTGGIFSANECACVLLKRSVG